MTGATTTVAAADVRGLTARERFDRGLPIDGSRGRTVNVTVIVNAKPAETDPRATRPVG